MQPGFGTRKQSTTIPRVSLTAPRQASGIAFRKSEPNTP